MNKELIKEYADIDYPNNKPMNEWVQKDYLIEAVKLSTGVICGFEKPHVKKDFCFSDEGADYERYKELHSDDDRMKRYFFYQNLKEYDKMISIFKGEDERTEPAICTGSDPRIGTATSILRWEEPTEYIHKLADEDIALILKTLETLRECFVKRLNTWWKKYGVEKLHTWTYWADR